MEEIKKREKSNKPIFDESAVRNYGVYFSLKQMQELEELYLKLEIQLKTLYILSEDFLKYGMEACERYRNYRKDNNFIQTASDKDFEYVKNSLLSTVLESYRQMNK